jgi:hypothetical protein
MVILIKKRSFINLRRINKNLEKEVKIEKQHY